MIQDMSKGERTYVVLLVVVWALVWPSVRPPENDGQLRFQNDVIRVDVSELVAWGADPDALRGWQVPVEFVDHDADVTFQVGTTKSQYVEGFGTLYVAGEAKRVRNRDNWVESCTVTLSNHDRPDRRSATAIAVHEFGHCLGMEHNDEHKSIMSTVMDSETVPNPLFSYEPTPDDVRVLSKRLAS